MKKKLILCLFLIICILIFNLYSAYGATEVTKKYSDEELLILQKSGNEIKKEYTDTTVISVEKIISTTLDFKFDTPPVIFQDRTLVPVRIITESLGANVTWYPSSRKVLIEKDTNKITLFVDDNKVIVNNTDKKIDVPAKIFCSRTYVPLRFVVEEFGLEIKYDSKTGVITIDE